MNEMVDNIMLAREEFAKYAHENVFTSDAVKSQRLSDKMFDLVDKYDLEDTRIFEDLLSEVM